jgi:hypothetical protein
MAREAYRDGEAFRDVEAHSDVEAYRDVAENSDVEACRDVEARGHIGYPILLRRTSSTSGI